MLPRGRVFDTLHAHFRFPGPPSSSDAQSTREVNPPPTTSATTCWFRAPRTRTTTTTCHKNSRMARSPRPTRPRPRPRRTALVWGCQAMAQWGTEILIVSRLTAGNEKNSGFRSWQLLRQRDSCGDGNLSTGRIGWMERKWKESKQRASILPGPAVPGCCLISLHFLWLSTPSALYNNKPLSLENSPFFSFSGWRVECTQEIHLFIQFNAINGAEEYWWTEILRNTTDKKTWDALNTVLNFNFLDLRRQTPSMEKALEARRPQPVSAQAAAAGAGTSRRHRVTTPRNISRKLNSR